MTSASKAMRSGENLANKLLPVIMAVEASEDMSEIEGVQFWAGFMAHMIGAMNASVGADAAEAIVSSFKVLQPNIAKEIKNIEAAEERIQRRSDIGMSGVPLVEKRPSNKE